MVSTEVSISGYQVSEELYKGSRTLVYRGYRESDSLPVVIKLLKNTYPSFNELVQFRNQYTIAKNLNYPGIIQTYSLETYHNGYALVMEDFGGISLKDYFNYLETLDVTSPLQEFLQVAISLCDILETLYQQRVIHKDIKPANILINPETKQVKLIDFSIASLLSKETQEIKNPNVLEGTLSYISPEQTGRMNRGIDYRSDFYSLGVTLFELLTGKLPFISDDAMELVHCHIAKQPPQLPHPSPLLVKERGQDIIELPFIGKERGQEIPSVLNDIVMKLMAKNAEDRYQSASGLKHDLKTCLYQLKETGNIESFAIAQKDICDRFIIPDKLYGRDKEVEQLLKAFDRVSSGNSEMMLVAGFSGIGKTAVVNEVHKPIVKQCGYFIKGKFDQFNRNIPLSAFVEALRDLIKQLISESDTKIQQWKSKILAALGDNAQVIIDVIPELESILDKQPAVAELSGTAAQNRFNLLFQKLFEVFTTKEHPLVIFLDDLQWADSASLNLINLLISDSEDKNLLLIAAYRDNEVSDTHPLMLTLSEISQSEAIINKITLTPLKEESLNQLVVDTLNCSIKIAQPLTKLIYQKTKGNPFFSTQLLKALYEDGLIKFNFEKSSWIWDITKVKSLTLTDDVVKFMVLQLQKLPASTQNVLKIAACIGNQFDLATLAIVCQKSETETADNLWKALQFGIILPQSEIYKFYLDSEIQQPDLKNSQIVSYKFLHDRVQEAAYLLISDRQKQATHLKIGKLLLENIPEAQREENIFIIVNQLNLGVDLISRQSNRNQLAELNLNAAKKAKASTAYGLAIKYSKIAIELLPEESWETDYELTLALYLIKAEVEYLYGNFENSNNLLETVLNKTKNLLDSIKAYQLQIEVSIAQIQMQKALEIGFAVMEKLGIKLEETPPIIEEVESLINLPAMTDSYKQAAIKILLQIFDAAYVTNHKLQIPVTFTAMNLCLNYGNSSITAPVFAAYGLLLCSYLNDIDTGYRFGKLSLQISEKYHAAEYKTFVYGDFNGYIRLWKESVRETLDSLISVYYSGLESGKIIYGGYAILNYCTNSFLVGESLNSVEEKHSIYLKELEKQQLNYHVVYAKIGRQLILNLLGKSENTLEMTGEAFQELEMIPLLREQNNGTSLYYVYFAKAMLCYLFALPEKAIAYLNMAENYAKTVSGLFISAQHNFYQSLAILAQYSHAEKSQQEDYLNKINQNQERMQQWAYHAPINFQNKYDLIAAEKARVLEQKLEAIELYEKAIYTAKENEYIHEEALANELAAKFYLDWGKEKFAALHMQEAYYCYARWGAKSKTDDLEKRYPQLLMPILQTQKNDLQNLTNSTIQTIASNGNIFLENLDVASILKASQALSCEIQLERFISNLIQVVMENAGAKKAALLLLKDEFLMLEALADINQDIRFLNIPYQDSQDIPFAIVSYVKRSLNTFLLDDATTQNCFITDPYLIKQQPKSVLCMPILDRGKLIGILYLENRLSIGAFTQNGIEILNLLITQAAISLNNAKLYEQLEYYSHSLEQKVKERTIEVTEKATQLESTLKELQHTQAQLIQAEKMSSLGQLIAGIAHEINNPISFISGNLIPANEYVESLIELINLYQNYIHQSPPEIELKIAEMELDYLVDDLPKLLNSMKIGAERIRDIVVSLRNFSRLDEAGIKSVDIHSGIDSTLLILQHQLTSNNKYPEIEVIKKYDPLPQITCYASELNQVFMNIIGNAIDALREKQEKKPRITIRTSKLDFQSILISIADNGIGIKKSVVNKIFDPFFTTKPVGSGTGLGLSTSYSIVVKKHGGKLSCNSVLGEGTEFIIEIPV